MIQHRQYVMNLVRWRKGAPRAGRSFPPLAANHVAVEGGCPLCPAKLGNGQRVVQLAIGPTDQDAARAHNVGEEYTAGALLAHLPCINRFSPSELEIALRDIDFLSVNGGRDAFEGQASASTVEPTFPASPSVAFSHGG
jgi:hypothetical protein